MNTYIEMACLERKTINRLTIKEEESQQVAEVCRGGCSSKSSHSGISESSSMWKHLSMYVCLFVCVLLINEMANLFVDLSKNANIHSSIGIAKQFSTLRDWSLLLMEEEGRWGSK